MSQDVNRLSFTDAWGDHISITPVNGYIYVTLTSGESGDNMSVELDRTTALQVIDSLRECLPLTMLVAESI